jgi:hypothetical protein
MIHPEQQGTRSDFAIENGPPAILEREIIEM